MCRLDEYSKTQLFTNNIQTRHQSWSNSKLQGDIAKDQVSTALNNKEDTLWPITATPEDPWTIQGKISHTGKSTTQLIYVVDSQDQSFGTTSYQCPGTGCQSWFCEQHPNRWREGTVSIGLLRTRKLRWRIRNTPQTRSSTTFTVHA